MKWTYVISGCMNLWFCSSIKKCLCPEYVTTYYPDGKYFCTVVGINAINSSIEWCERFNEKNSL